MLARVPDLAVVVDLEGEEDTVVALAVVEAMEAEEVMEVAHTVAVVLATVVATEEAIMMEFLPSQTRSLIMQLLARKDQKQSTFET